MATKSNKKAEVVAPDVLETESSGATRKKEEKIIPKEVDLNQYITVKNGFQGTLLYKSKRTGEVYIWDSFGDEQEIELRELKSAKNSSKKFFTENWFMFDDQWVVEYLGVSKYYKNSFSIEGFDDIFKKTPAELEKAIAEMTPSQKRSVSYRARELVIQGVIDSIKTITALEKALDIELIEK